MSVSQQGLCPTVTRSFCDFSSSPNFLVKIILFRFNICPTVTLYPATASRLKSCCFSYQGLQPLKTRPPASRIHPLVSRPPASLIKVCSLWNQGMHLLLSWPLVYRIQDWSLSYQGIQPLLFRSASSRTKACSLSCQGLQPLRSMPTASRIKASSLS